MKIAGETKEIVWHIFRTYTFKQQIHCFQFNFFFELMKNDIIIYTAYIMIRSLYWTSCWENQQKLFGSTGVCSNQQQLIHRSHRHIGREELTSYEIVLNMESGWTQGPATLGACPGSREQKCFAICLYAVEPEKNNTFSTAHNNGRHYCTSAYYSICPGSTHSLGPPLYGMEYALY
jgi:hypothetical protein